MIVRVRDSEALLNTCDPYCGPISVTVSPVWPLSTSTIYRFICPEVATILFAQARTSPPTPDISLHLIIVYQKNS